MKIISKTAINEWNMNFRNRLGYLLKSISFGKIMLMKIQTYFVLLLTLIFVACSGDDKGEIIPTDDFIRAADLSFVPEITANGTVYKNNNQPENILVTLKNAGCNTVRIRLWKDPAEGRSGMAEVKAFSQQVRQAGMKVWLTVHYSDIWADPGTQAIPEAWEAMPFAQLKTAVAEYTETIIDELQPDIFQIGNETNDGFIWPHGRLTTNPSQYLELVSTASDVIRTKSAKTKIMLHFAGLSGADWYFDKVKTIDYDYIGLSYYPIFHGKSITAVSETIENLGTKYSKKVLIAETSYPFTLGWNDWTNNIVGLDEQLIPGYPASPTGQKDFMLALRSAVENANGAGFCYWGGEWVAFRGTEAPDGSSYENQALYDFELNALPVMEVFAE